MEHVRGFRAALSNVAAKELKAFECVLRHELARRDDLHCVEVRKLKEEIEELRLKASRAAELEFELQRSRDPVPAGPAVPGNSNEQYPDSKQAKAMQFILGSGKSSEGQRHDLNECHGDYQQRFMDCSRELQRVKDALDFWQVEAKRWRLAYRNIHRNSPWKGPVSSGQRTRNPPAISLAPASGSPLHANPVETRSSYRKLASLGKSSPLPPRSEQIHSHTGPQSKQIKIPLEHKSTDIEQANSPRDATEFGTPASQIQEDGDTELDVALEEQLPPTSRQDNELTCKRHSVGINRVKSGVEEDSDNLVFVSEINLKRTRVETPVETPPKSTRLKEDLFSSSPAAPHACVGANGVHESIDLDEVTNRLYTPRKDQRKRRQIHTANRLAPSRAMDLGVHPDESLLFGKADTLLADVGDEFSSMADGGTSSDKLPHDIPDEAWCYREGQRHAARLMGNIRMKRREGTRAKQGRHNRRERIKKIETERLGADLMQNQNEHVSHNPAHRPVLQPIDANRALPRTTNDVPGQKRDTSSIGWHHGAPYINCLSEDGESGPDTEITDRRQHDQAARTATLDDAPKASRAVKTPAGHRLDQLLARPSPGRPRLSPANINTGIAKSSNTSKTPSTNAKETRQINAIEAVALGQDAPPSPTKPRPLPSSTKAPIIPQTSTTYISPFSKPSSISKNPHPTDNTSPLRSRPLSHLSLLDFKINPAQNQGFTHPFKETVRSRKQRNCLPGCTRLECCGTMFRKMAETGLFRPYHTSGLFASSQEDEDQKMMEDFLGDQAYRLRKMSKEDKAEVLLRAKTMILADHFGKHREVYAREPSPVGYWDVDMPNSQEAAEQKRMAEIRTRQKVEERYNAAMKKDGEWKFRDE
ncbi:MAG: hypothetical protein Q9184_002408 [Pyrenodesmia sp. 2 TL-2023]